MNNKVELYQIATLALQGYPLNEVCSRYKGGFPNNPLTLKEIECEILKFLLVGREYAVGELESAYVYRQWQEYKDVSKIRLLVSKNQIGVIFSSIFKWGVRSGEYQIPEEWRKVLGSTYINEVYTEYNFAEDCISNLTRVQIQRQLNNIAEKKLREVIENATLDVRKYQQKPKRGVTVGDICLRKGFVREKVSCTSAKEVETTRVEVQQNVAGQILKVVNPLCNLEENKQKELVDKVREKILQGVSRTTVINTVHNWCRRQKVKVTKPEISSVYIEQKRVLLGENGSSEKQPKGIGVADEKTSDVLEEVYRRNLGNRPLTEAERQIIWEVDRTIKAYKRKEMIYEKLLEYWLQEGLPVRTINTVQLMIKVVNEEIFKEERGI